MFSVWITNHEWITSWLDRMVVWDEQTGYMPTLLQICFSFQTREVEGGITCWFIEIDLWFMKLTSVWCLRNCLAQQLLLEFSFRFFFWFASKFFYVPEKNSTSLIFPGSIFFPEKYEVLNRKIHTKKSWNCIWYS